MLAGYYLVVHRQLPARSSSTAAAARSRSYVNPLGAKVYYNNIRIRIAIFNSIDTLISE